MRQRQWSVVLAAVLAGAAVGGVLPVTEASAITTPGVTVAGGNGAGSAANQLNEPGNGNSPAGVSVDSSGDVYVVDNGNNRVQEWAPGATAGVTVAGGNGAGSAANQLSFPGGIFVDSSGNLYVADTGYAIFPPQNNRVQEWTPGATSGVTVAGGNGAGSAADQLSYPTDVFVDGAGNIYVEDSGNNRVQKFAPPAPPTTSVLLPSKGATLSGGTWLDAGASSPIGVSSVTFEVSAGRSGSEKVIGSATSTLWGWLAGWDTTKVHNGTYTLRSVATDALGHSTTSASVTVKVDNRS
jgi:DNA-binding beta-propeller fold protein YncE